jgi:hypothetical protein
MGIWCKKINLVSVGLQVQIWNEEEHVDGVPCHFALNEDAFDWYEKSVAVNPPQVQEMATGMAKLNVQESGQVVPDSVISMDSVIIETQPVHTQFVGMSSPWKGNCIGSDCITLV